MVQLHHHNATPILTTPGAISTGSHGSSLHHGTLADSVAGVELVTFDGRRLELRDIDDENRKDGAQLLRAARTALGQLGSFDRPAVCLLTCFCAGADHSLIDCFAGKAPVACACMYACHVRPIINARVVVDGAANTTSAQSS